jgi:hypothetical protein
MATDIFAVIIATATATLHCCQSIIFSGFRLIPGDSIDARFNNLTLEHIYSALNGYYQLWSPSQFYPTPNTLVYSDNHFGTAIFYIIFRSLNTDIETSFQCWLITITVLNAISLYWLLRTINISPWICAACVFLGTSSLSLIAQIGHPQILPLFPFILCLRFLIRTFQRASIIDLSLAIVFYAYIHWCYLYYGYLCTWILLLITLCLFSLQTSQQRREFIARLSCRRHYIFLIAAALFTLVALTYIYAPYIQYSSSGAERPIIELQKNAPHWSSWFSACPYSLFYKHQNFLPPAGEINQGENFLFTGWSIWIIATLGLFQLILNRGMPRFSFEHNLTISLLIVLIVILLLFTTYPSGASFYIWLCTHISKLGAFRAFSRIAQPLGIIESIVAALILQSLWANVRMWRRTIVAGGIILLPIENLCWGASNYSKLELQNRAEAILEQWRPQSINRTLIFTPGFANVSSDSLQLDAWSAALRVHGYCINGYSGNVPKSREFRDFLLNPTKTNADHLLTALKLPRDSVAPVSDWTDRAHRATGIQFFADIKPSIAPHTLIRTVKLHPAEPFEAAVSLKYEGQFPLDPSSARIFLSYRIYNDKNVSVDDTPSLRTPMPPFSPGNSVEQRMEIIAPSHPGHYFVHLSIVHEGIAWWEDLGKPGDTIDLTVENP